MIIEKGTLVGDKRSATNRLITDDVAVCLHVLQQTCAQNFTIVTFVRLFMKMALNRRLSWFHGCWHNGYTIIYRIKCHHQQYVYSEFTLYLHIVDIYFTS